MSETLADRLVAFVLSTRFEDLPPEVVAEARRRLIDASRPALSGPSTSPHRPFRGRSRHEFKVPPSVGLDRRRTAAPDWAAFANGVHIRYLDCNDTYLSLEPAHPSDNWAAVMAAGQAAGADGKAWIAAGCGRVRGPMPALRCRQHPGRGWDHTTYGSISSTLAAAKLLGLSHEQACMRWASPARPALHCGLPAPASCRCGRAARSPSRLAMALFAAQLAAEGITGPAPLFEGEMGFFAASLRTIFACQAGRHIGRRLDATENFDQVCAGRVSQPVGHRRSFHPAEQDR